MIPPSHLERHPLSLHLVITSLYPLPTDLHIDRWLCDRRLKIKMFISSGKKSFWLFFLLSFTIYSAFLSIIIQCLNVRYWTSTSPLTLILQRSPNSKSSIVLLVNLKLIFWSLYRKKPKDLQHKVRLMAPFSMRCESCGEYIYKGKKFNARKETVEGERYLSIQIFRFYIR
jgi:hypothetical protein